MKKRTIKIEFQFGSDFQEEFGNGLIDATIKALDYFVSRHKNNKAIILEDSNKKQNEQKTNNKNNTKSSKNAKEISN